MTTEADEASSIDLELALQQLSLRDGKFPEQALRTVQRCRNVATPLLIESLEQAAELKAAG